MMRNYIRKDITQLTEVKRGQKVAVFLLRMTDILLAIKTLCRKYARILNTMKNL